MPKTDHVTIKIPRELIEEMDKLKGKYGFRSRGEMAKEAIRYLLDKYASESELAHYNLNEEGVLVLDRTLQPDRIVRVYFRPEGPWCEHCESMSCRHVEFALDIPKVQEILREKGWKMK